MELTRHKLAKMLDYSVLRPDCGESVIREACELTRRYNFAALYVNPCWLWVTSKELSGTDIEIGTTISFPFGTATTKVKLAEAEDALDLGATALDMVINIGTLKDGDHKLVLDEIKGLVKLADGKVTKIIIENGMLTREEIATACKLVEEGGATFVKSSTGQNARGILLEEIRLMRDSVSPAVGVKVSGFQGYWPEAIALACIKAGADRLGTGFAKRIVDSLGILQG